MKFTMERRGYGIPEIEGKIQQLEAEGKSMEAWVWKRQLANEKALERESQGSSCSICAGKKYLYDLVENVAYPCNCKLDAHVLSVVGPRHFKADLNDFPELSGKVREMLNGPSFAITGEPGSGKTHMLAAIYRLRSFLHDPVMFYRYSDILQMIRDFRESDDFQVLMEKIQDHPKGLVFLLDDLCLGEASGFVSENLYRLVDALYIGRHQVIFSTNHDSKTMMTLLGPCAPQIISRLALSRESIKLEKSVRIKMDSSAGAQACQTA